MTINEAIEGSFIERRKDRRELCMLHWKELTELHHAIYGNGDLKKGLIWIAEENRLGIAGLQEFVMQFKRNSWKLFWGFLLPLLRHLVHSLSRLSSWLSRTNRTYWLKFSWRFRGMKIPSFILKIIGKSISKKFDLKEDNMETKDTKKWWKSKTILTAIFAALIGFFNTIDATAGPALGFDLPTITDWVFSILAAIGIYGRVDASKKIG